MGFEKEGYMKTCKGRMQMFSEGGAGGGALILYASLWVYVSNTRIRVRWRLGKPSFTIVR